ILLPEGATVTDRNGTAYVGRIESGTYIENILLPAGSVFSAGSEISGLAQISIDSLTLPAGSDLFGLQIQSADEFNESKMLLPQDLLPRGMTINGFEGSLQTQRIVAVASLLPEGMQSWDLKLVAGADLAAADRRSTLEGSEGDLTLSNPFQVRHHSGSADTLEGISVIRTG